MILLKQKSDILGSLASTLCLVHCIATPLLFLAQASATTLSSGPPTWWKSLDYLFLIISFAAIFWTTKTTTINWLKPLMWISYFVLSAIIINEKLELFPIPEVAIYVPTVALVILHLYNRKYCKCATDNCCVNEG
ncbi:MerC domain-containing protein [Maribacter sp. SA7]|uniref:MerC domain-containing protein n=1 Tax=Maribacter zhoushanensis TaxID=3030012 RepID=UPI0023EB7024|nr:MerC domain-containing protein [Maribacter zhoushanensis]MDF4202937.1 MerC domain-containing protein [Maribacter zhoushanensis]